MAPDRPNITISHSILLKMSHFISLFETNMYQILLSNRQQATVRTDLNIYRYKGGLHRNYEHLTNKYDR